MKPVTFVLDDGCWSKQILFLWGVRLIFLFLLPAETCKTSENALGRAIDPSLASSSISSSSLIDFSYFWNNPEILLPVFDAKTILLFLFLSILPDFISELFFVAYTFVLFINTGMWGYAFLSELVESDIFNGGFLSAFLQLFMFENLIVCNFFDEDIGFNFIDKFIGSGFFG